MKPYRDYSFNLYQPNPCFSSLAPGDLQLTTSAGDVSSWRWQDGINCRCQLNISYLRLSSDGLITVWWAIYCMLAYIPLDGTQMGPNIICFAWLSGYRGRCHRGHIHILTNSKYKWSAWFLQIPNTLIVVCLLLYIYCISPRTDAGTCYDESEKCTQYAREGRCSAGHSMLQEHSSDCKRSCGMCSKYNNSRSLRRNNIVFWYQYCVWQLFHCNRTRLRTICFIRLWD
jgi:hypothetical protein